MKVSMEVIKDDASVKLMAMTMRCKTLDVLWKRSLKKYYQSYQIERWMTSNWGEWKPLTSEKYIAWKKKTKTLFRMGELVPMKKSGTQLMVASGFLSESVSLASTEHSREIATPTSIEVYTTLPYAKYVNKERSFKKYSPEFKESIKKAIMKYIKGGTGGVID